VIQNHSPFFKVLLELFSWLTPKDIISLSKTCRLFKNAATVDKLWAQVCFNEFGIQLKPSSNGFVKRFYKNGMNSNQFAEIHCLCVLQSLFLSFIILVLYKYGPLLGLWTKVARDKDRYGSLIKILVHLFYKIRF